MAFLPVKPRLCGQVVFREVGSGTVKWAGGRIARIHANPFFIRSEPGLKIDRPQASAGARRLVIWVGAREGTG